MRVLIANNYYYLRGGAERVMFNDMQALLDAGVEVIPFSAADPDNVPSDYSKYFVAGADIHATSPFRRLRAGWEAIHCGRTAAAFAAAIDKVRPDVVHFHNIYGRLSTSLLPVVRRRQIPAALTLHDYKVVCPSYLMLHQGKPCDSCLDGRFYRCALRRCHKHNAAASIVYTLEAYLARIADRYGAVSAFLCPSRFMKTLLIRYGVDPDVVVYHPNAVNPDAYQPRYEGAYVLYVGRLSHEKGLLTLLEAMAGTGIPLRIAGSGPMEHSVRAAAAIRGESVVLEGHCEGSRLETLCRNAAFIVVPSEWYENAPMSVIEAFAYGKPVIATRIGGIPELVADGETGSLVDCWNPDQLKAAVTRLWRDRTAQQRMGRKARELVEGKLSQATRTRSLIDIYENLCDARRRRLKRPNDLVAAAS